MRGTGGALSSSSGLERKIKTGATRQRKLLWVLFSSTQPLLRFSIRSPVPKDERDCNDKYKQQTVDETEILAGLFREVFECANGGVSAVVIDGHCLTEYYIGFRSTDTHVLLIVNRERVMTVVVVPTSPDFAFGYSPRARLLHTR